MNRSVRFVIAIVIFLTACAGLPDSQTIAQTSRPTLKFDFGPGKVQSKYLQVLPTTLYTKTLGYGFEPGATVVCADRGGKDHLRSDLCTAGTPFFFSVALPEGNYNVSITFGDQNGDTTTTVKAELRRLMLKKVKTKRGKFATETFTVNIRRPQISSGGEVKLKDREKTMEVWAWDEKLTLEFNNTRPTVNALEIIPADTVPTLFLLGDSTVTDQPREPYNSWGQMLTRFFKPGIALANHAQSGESLRSSLGARRLDKVLSLMKPGDYLFIQYGHNDQKEKGEGVGPFTTYKESLKHYVSETRKLGGNPVLITSMHRRTFDAGGKINDSHGDYDDAVRQVAKEETVPLIDLHAMSKPFYEALGPEVSKQAFAPEDNTHHNNYGSYQLARCIVESIRVGDFGLARYLVDDVSPYDPRHPDDVNGFNVPPSPLITDIKPLGS